MDENKIDSASTPKTGPLDYLFIGTSSRQDQLGVTEDSVTDYRRVSDASGFFLDHAYNTSSLETTDIPDFSSDTVPIIAASGTPDFTSISGGTDYVGTSISDATLRSYMGESSGDTLDFITTSVTQNIPNFTATSDYVDESEEPFVKSTFRSIMGVVKATIAPNFPVTESKQGYVGGGESSHRKKEDNGEIREFLGTATQQDFPDVTSASDYVPGIEISNYAGSSTTDIPELMATNTPINFWNISAESASTDGSDFRSTDSGNSSAILTAVTSGTTQGSTSDILDFLTNGSVSPVDLPHPTTTNYTPVATPFDLLPNFRMGRISNGEWEDPFPPNLTGGTTEAVVSHPSDEYWAGVPVADDVWRVHLVSYGVLLPLVVLVGVIINSIGLVLLSRKKLKDRPVNP